MKRNRRNFLKIAGMSTIAGGILPSAALSATALKRECVPTSTDDIAGNSLAQNDLSIIGQYGQWAASKNEGKLPSLSFRRPEFTDLEQWRTRARTNFIDRLAVPAIEGVPSVKVNKRYAFDGLQIEEISWQLPYGRPTEAIVLKPEKAAGRLPAVLALHDHGGNKYFGTQKITKTDVQQHPMMASHQQNYYEGFAWANELAKRGFIVLVPDAFAFASRRVMLQDVPMHQRQGLTDPEPNNEEQIDAYNKWAGQHEHILARSLFSAGTTWPGVFLAEDMKALDMLASRSDVDPKRIGCGGLSGGGLRTAYLAGADPRIKCAVCVGFMSTWRDFVLNKSYTHTWMVYTASLPNELDFPEILGMRAPLPTLVLNDSQDQLYTLPEMEKADQILAEVYGKAGAGDSYRCSYYPGPHKFDKAMQAEAFDWFEKWL